MADATMEEWIVLGLAIVLISLLAVFVGWWAAAGVALYGCGGAMVRLSKEFKAGTASENRRRNARNN